MMLHIEIFLFHREQAHGAIWLDDGAAIPISMPISAYETAVQRGLFLRSQETDHLFPDENGVLDETTIFLSPNHTTAVRK